MQINAGSLPRFLAVPAGGAPADNPAAELAALRAAIAQLAARLDALEARQAAPAPVAIYVPASAPAYAPAPAPSYAPVPAPSYAPTPAPGYSPTPASAPAPRLLQDWWSGAVASARRFVARLRLPSEGQAPAPGPAPAAPAAAPPPPITVETIRVAARAYVAAHPEIRDAMSYDETAAVAQLRDGVIAALRAQGYRAGRVHGPDGQPYDQVVAYGNPNDPVAIPYRVTAGGGRIERAIEAGYSDEALPWSDVH